MKILFIQPSNSVGGAELSLLSLIRYLSTNEVAVYLCLPEKGDLLLSDLARPFVKEVFFVSVSSWNLSNDSSFLLRTINLTFRLFLSGGGIFKSVSSLIDIIKTHNIDLVHSNTLVSIDGPVAAKYTGVKHVQHVRELIGESSEAIIKFPLQNHPWLFKYFMRHLHDKVIVNSQYTRNNAIVYFDERMLKCIYNPIDNEYFRDTQRSLESNCVVGLVGNVTSTVKNHHLFIEIAKKFLETYGKTQNVKFAIYGTLPNSKNSYYASLKTMVEEFQLSDTVQFKGRYESAAIYEEVDVLVHTCTQEAFGRIYIEAMAGNVPVISVNSGAARELIQNDVTGFIIDNDSPQHFADVINVLLTDTVKRNHIITNAKKFSSYFKSESICRELLNTYEVIMKPKDKED